MPAAPITEKDLKIFCSYVNDNRVLIVDTSSASRVRLAATLTDLGVQSSKITLAGDFTEGLTQLNSFKPRLVICDYSLGTQSGLDLLQTQRSHFKDIEDSCVFILITGNSSQTAVARAAEEDVDSFILKPYTLESLKISLVNAVVSKINPTEYVKVIREGKALLYAAKPLEALPKFEAAAKLDPAPTLALYYRAQCQSLLQVIEQAEESFREGLNLNKIHYKCLIGFFDLLSAQKRNDEAYGVVKRISQYFPANPKRLSSVLRLAIITKNYDDMEGYYRTFVQIDARDDELVRYMCSALVVCGKYYLLRKHRTKALEVFEKAAITCAGQIQFLKYIIETLVEFELADSAVGFYQRYRSVDPGSDMTKTLEYMVSSKKEGLSASIERGRALLKAGVKHPTVYRLLIRQCVDAGLEDSSENLAQTAAKAWPDRATEFLSLAGLDVQAALAA